MKKHDKINLDSISNINEIIIDEVTDKKISLLQKAGKTVSGARKKMIAIISIAAACLLVFSVLLIPLLNFNVPVYQGMTIRSATEPISMSGKGYIPLSDTECLSAVYSPILHGPKDDHREHNNKLEHPIESLVTIDVIADEEVRYYVSPGETFIIEVHIDNPKDYEIQSFTLNGQKYANYMFKEGSTMELLLLEVTAPDEPGYVEYTIDAIKYIDGTEIKDVDMSSGDKSVKAGIAYPTAPSAFAITKSISPTSIELSIRVSDPHSLTSGNVLAAYISDGERIVDTKPLTIGSNTVTFDGLIASRIYEYGVVAVFDMVDGNDLHKEWLLVKEFTSPEIFSIQNTVATPDSISFEVKRMAEIGEITSVSLYDAVTNELVEMGGAEVRAFKNLLAGHAYHLYVDFSYTVNGETMTDWVGIQEITTPVYYTATFVSNGGSEIPSAKYYAGQELPVPTREGYTFGGWSTTADLAQTSLTASEGALEGDTIYYAWWKEETKPVHFQYIGTTEIAIIGVNNGVSELEELCIPAYIGGVPVVEIGQRAFEGLELEKFVIGNNVKTIRRYAFSNCLYMFSIVIPESVEVIEEDAFSGCVHFVEVYNLSNQSVGYPVLVEHQSLDTPSMIKRDKDEATGVYRSRWFLEIGTKAYLFASRNNKLPSQSPSGYSYEIMGYTYYWGEDAWGSRITELVIPDGVAKIGAYAFVGLNLQSVTIPASVKEIGPNAFSENQNLTSVVFENQENWYRGEALANVSNPYANAYEFQHETEYSPRWYVKES